MPLDTPEDTQDKIRERAHAIWEAQGHPDGLADAHWAQAEAEITAALEASQASEPGAQADDPADIALPNPLASGAAAQSLAKPKRTRKST